MHFLEEKGDTEKGSLNIIGIPCDVSSEESVTKAYDEVISRFGRVDSVVASAGV